MGDLNRQAEEVLRRMPAGERALSVAEARAAVAARSPAPAPEVPFEDHHVPGAGGGRFRVRVYRTASQTPQPALVYYHGGGFICGSIEGHDSLCRMLASTVGCAVASVEYRLAPEHPFPTPVHDAYTALSWVHESADELGIDHTRIAVGGDSAGGNLATVAARQAKERRGPPVAYQVLYYPVTDLGSIDTASYDAFASGFGLSRQEMAFCRDAYLPSSDDFENPSASPLRAGNLIGLPAAYIVTAECDPLRDEAEAYAGKLSEAGVPVVMERYAGQIHAFVRMYDQIDDGRRVIARTAELLAPALGLD